MNKCMSELGAVEDAVDNSGWHINIYQRPDTDEVLTQVMENNLTQLESLRSGLERAHMKDIDDVRTFGDTFAGSLLTGVEDRFDYDDLLDLIREFKDGIARRRLAAETNV